MATRPVCCALLFLSCTVLGHAGEEIQPMAASGGVLHRNMVRITLPSIAARTAPAEVAIEARDMGFADIPGIPGLPGQMPELPARSRYVAAMDDPVRHHVPEEMRFPMEPPLGPPDRAIATNQAFTAMLDDLVVFDGQPAPVAPATIPASLPMPSEVLRNQDPYAGFVPLTPSPAPIALEPSTFAPVVEAPSAITTTDFGQTSRRASAARPEPAEFATLRNLRSAMSVSR